MKIEIENEHIVIKNINRIKKENCKHARSKDGYAKGESNIFAIYIDFGNGYEKIKSFFNKEKRDAFYQELLYSIDSFKINDKFRFYEEKELLLVVEKEQDKEKYIDYFGEMFSIIDGKIIKDGLYNVREYKNKKIIDFTPINQGEF